MKTAKTQPRWLRLVPDWLALGLLALEGFLPLSARLHWLSKGWALLIALLAAAVVACVMFAWFRRRRFQFGVRSLLVLAVAVALPLGWFSWEINKANRQGAAVAAIEELDGEVHWSEPLGPRALRSLLGDGFLNSVWSVDFSSPKVTDDRLKELCSTWPVDLGSPKVTDAGLEHLAGLSRLLSLGLVGAQVSDAGLEHLKGLSQLRVLWLSGTKITDAGLKHLEGLKQLRVLWLSGTQVGDTGLEHLEGLSQLQVLWLNGTNITDAGLERLKGLKHLHELWLSGSKVTDKGVKKFKPEFPDCKIVH
jgi:hypothetical protein